MAKLTEPQKKQVREAMAAGKPLPEGVRVNFGDPEPYQKNDELAPKPAEKQD